MFTSAGPRKEPISADKCLGSAGSSSCWGSSSPGRLSSFTLTRAAPARPPAAQLRAALYQHAFNPARTTTADAATTQVLA